MKKKEVIFKKPTYSPSRLVNYIRCPRSFSLSLDHKPNLTASQLDNYRTGNIFEGFVFGFKEEEGPKSQKQLIGSKRPGTIERLKYQAAITRKIFRAPRKYSYKFYQHELDTCIVRGEMDYIGPINKNYLAEKLLVTDRELVAKIPKDGVITDLKFTNDISRVWDYKGATREDYLQASIYPYLYYKETGRLFDFMYLIVEGIYKNPIFRLVYLHITQEVINWVEELVDLVDKDIFFAPKPGKDVCLAGINQSRCSYMDFCEYGRKLVGGFREAELMRLTSEISLKKQRRDAFEKKLEG